VTFALSAICNHSATICDRMSPTIKSTGRGSLWAKISGCSPWSRPLMFRSAESEHPRLTNGEIISEEFQLYVITIHQRHRRTDRRRAIARPRFALKCTVHRAVKKCRAELKQNSAGARLDLVIVQSRVNRFKVRRKF